jgi:hypothetical protein
VESEQGKGATFFFELPAEAGMVPEPGILEDAAQRDP